MAIFLGKEACMMFADSYLTNVGTISALVGVGDVAYLDEYSHSSLSQGASAARCTIKRYRHNDMNIIERS